MYETLEEWYDGHPDATYGEIELEARRHRRVLMGRGLEILINGRDTGQRAKGVECSACGGLMEFKGYPPWTIHGLEGDVRLERAYYVCPKCEGETIFPLDRKLQLREDHWSEGAARVIARQGLRESSFEWAAEAYTEAVGSSVSGSSVRRVTQGFGKHLTEQKKEEAERAMAIGPLGETPRTRRVALKDAIEEVGNVSSDGTMVLVREEGWKEVKIATFSKVEVLEPDSEKRRKAQREGKRGQREIVRLSAHSYCAGLWDADTFGPYQYAEGLRRGFDLLKRSSSVNDGALWIERITGVNFPQATQVTDWSHSTQRLWAVANAVYDEGNSSAAAWVERQKDDLWNGKAWCVTQELDRLDLKQKSYPDMVRQAHGYFRDRRERMQYDQFRTIGYPIGSGTVESGAKNVVQHRMRRPGRGWKRENAQSMLAALSELYSGRFLWAWEQIYHSDN